MSYVIAAYVATIGTLTIYGTRLVIRSRQIAAAVMARNSSEQAEHTV